MSRVCGLCCGGRSGLADVQVPRRAFSSDSSQQRTNARDAFASDFWYLGGSVN
jgi:hypothetical protein